MSKPNAMHALRAPPPQLMSLIGRSQSLGGPAQPALGLGCWILEFLWLLGVWSFISVANFVRQPPSIVEFIANQSAGEVE
jgi:hypothetical protein